MLIHTIDPIFDKNSKILILGSFPSVKSREAGFFYAHPRNRFWRVIADVCARSVPQSIDEKKRMLIENGIALWDTVQSCEITGSADSTIKNVRPNDISIILNAADIYAIFTNGKIADALYRKYIFEKTGIDSVCLPSTSPANAAWSDERLTEYWRKALTKSL